MNTIKRTSIKKVSFQVSKRASTASVFDLNNIRDSLEEGNRSVRRNVRGIWNKRLELFCGFIPALLVFVITYGKKFR